MARTSFGTTTDGLPSSDDPAEWDSARYSADMIEEALQNLHRTDRLSAYERRVALREVKDIVRQLMEDTQSVPLSVDVERYLGQSEDIDTNRQLVVLRDAMMRLLRHSESIAKEITSMCNKLSALWDAAGHSPCDLLEVRIKHSPAAIPPSPSSLHVIHALLEAWSDVALGLSTSPPSSSSGATLETWLTGMGVTGRASETLLRAAQQTPAYGAALAARISASIDELESLRADVAKLERIPLPAAAANRAESSPRTADGLAERESWLQRARDVATKIRHWETMSGIPFSAPVGPMLYVSAASKGEQGVADRDVTFLELLNQAVDAVQRSDLPTSV